VNIHTAGHKIKLEIDNGVTTIPKINISMNSDGDNQVINVGPGFTAQMADRITFHNISGTIETESPLIPFRPVDSGRLVKIIGSANEIQLKYPFSEDTELIATRKGTGAHIPVVFSNITFTEPTWETGVLADVKFTGQISFALGSGLHVRNMDFGDAALNVYYGLLSGLSELLLLGRDSTKGKPRKVKLIHEGENPKQFIRDRADLFANWSQEIICGHQLACDDWDVQFESIDPDFHSSNSILEAFCRPESEDPNGKCLAFRVKPTPVPVQSAGPAQPPSSKASSNKSAVGMAVGITVGVAVVVLVVCVIVVHLWTKRKYETLLSEVGSHRSLPGIGEPDANEPRSDHLELSV
jgi:hypothetical protein